LHGWGQDDQRVQRIVKDLSKKLSDVDVHGVMAPVEVVPPSNSATTDAGSDGAAANLGRAWFYYNKDNPSDFAAALVQSEIQYLHLDETIAYLASVFRDKGPFDCLIGFSQGAEIASILCYLGIQDAKSPFSSIRCAAFYSGLLIPLPTNKLLHGVYNRDTRLRLPTRHVLGKQDKFIENSNSLALAALYEDAVIHIHDKGHIPPSGKQELDELSAFIQRHARNDPSGVTASTRSDDASLQGADAKKTS